MKYINKVLLFAFLLVCVSEPGLAQFGKNKVQYKTFDWKVISSKYFDVYYDEGSKDLAEFTIIEAEKALKEIEKLLNFKANKRIPVLIYNSKNEFQQTNVINSYMSEGIQGVTELFKNRVVLPFLGEYSKFRHVIHHELVHAVLNQYLYGGTFQTAVQTGQNIQFPLYMNEGLAEFSSLFGQNVENDMFMRDLAMNERLRGLEYMNGYLAYRGGQTFYWYISEKFGVEKIAELIQRLKMGYTLDMAFNDVFKMSYKDFSELWAKDLKKYYWPDIEKFKSPEDYATRVTNHKMENTFYNSSPTISPDGSKIAYISDKDGLFGIFIRGIGSKDKPKQLVSSFRTQDFEELNLTTPGISWSPDAKYLAVSAKAGGEDAIFIIDVEDGDYEKLKFGIPAISSVAWSPDGKFLSFTGSQTGKSDLYLYEFSSKKTQRLINCPFSELLPQWSSDSKSLYFISDRADNLNSEVGSIKMWEVDHSKTDIYSIDINTKQINKISNIEDGNISSIAVSGDGSSIYFVSDKNGIGNIYSLNLKSGVVKPRTNSLTGITQLSMSKDDSKLVFSTMNEGGIDIFMIKYPADLSVPGDTLPLTKFKASLIASSGIVDDLVRNSPNTKDSSLTKTKKYGNFRVKLDKPEFIQPNPDAISDANDISSISNTTANFVEKDYKLQFSLDGIVGNPGYSTYYGFAGNAAAQFSDIMGDHSIYVEANLFRDLRNSNVMLSYQYMPKIIDYQISVFHNAAYVQRGNYSYYRFRNFGLSLNSALPFDRFNRFELGVNWYNASMENIDSAEVPSISRMLIVPEVRFVHDDVLYGWFAPYTGSRWYIGAKASPKISDGGSSFLTIDGDLRHYFTIFDYITFATRGSFAANIGHNPRSFYIGGTDNWFNRTFENSYLPVDSPEDYVFMQFATPLRGWNIAALSGTRYFLTNFEMRFPLFQALVAGPIPVLIQGVMGSFFFDMAGAWSGDLKSFRSLQTDSEGRTVPKDLRMSTGIGVRAYLLGLPLKMDIAWQNLHYTWSKPHYLFSLGFDF